MKRFFAICALLGGLLTTQAQCYQECDPCCSGCDRYLSVEGLYWTVTHSPIGVSKRGNQDSVDPEGATDQKYIFGDNYEGGARGRVGFTNCSVFAEASYLWFATNENARQNKGSFDAIGPAGSAPRASDFDEFLFVTGNSRFRYQNADVRLGHFFCRNSCFSPFLYLNARWLRVDYKSLIEAISDDPPENFFSIRQDSRFNGGALGLGLGGRFALCENVGISGIANFLAVVGETRFGLEKINLDLSYNPFWIKRYRWTNLTPGFEFRMEADVSCYISCFQISAAIGYELDYYSNLLFYFSENGPTTPASFRIPNYASQDVGFGGPYARLGVSF